MQTRGVSEWKRKVKKGGMHERALGFPSLSFATYVNEEKQEDDQARSNLVPRLVTFTGHFCGLFVPSGALRSLRFLVYYC